MTFSHPEKITLNVRVEALLNYSNNMNNNKGRELRHFIARSGD